MLLKHTVAAAAEAVIVGSDTIVTDTELLFVHPFAFVAVAV